MGINDVLKTSLQIHGVKMHISISILIAVQNIPFLVIRGIFDLVPKYFFVQMQQSLILSLLSDICSLLSLPLIIL